MSNTWPPQQEPPQTGWPQQEPPQAGWPQAGWPQSWYPPQPAPYDEPGCGYGPGYGTGYGPGYGTGYGAGYGAPGPSSAGRPGGWPPPQGDPWSQWGREPPQEMYQPGRPPPNLLPTPQAPYGAPDPYGTQDPYWAQGPYGPYGPYGTHPTRRPRSFNWFVPVVVLMVFAILVAAGGAYALVRYGPATTNPPATAQGTASRTPSIPAGFHAYTSVSVGVQFYVPNGWTTKDDVTQAGVHDLQAVGPYGMPGLVVASATSGEREEDVANRVLVAPSDSKTVDKKEGPTYVVFAGANWVRVAGDITAAGMRLHAAALAATHGDHLYVIEFVATTSNFGAADARYFQVVTRSFQFLS
jgi:hypothetical protein